MVTRCLLKWAEGGIEVDAVSVGGMETCIQVPSWRLCFDIGRCPPSAVKQRIVCFTHAHMDHMGGIAYHASLRDLMGMSPPTYLVPEEYAEDVAALLDVWRRLERSELPAEVRPVAPGDVIEVGRARKIHVFRSYHRIPTVGYALQRTAQRLRGEFVGLEGRKLGELRASGVDLTDPVEEVELAFCGDTTAVVLDREPLPRKAKALVLECTFLDESGADERAHRTGHVHLRAVADRAAALGELRGLLLTHFSARYSPRRIQERLDACLPAELRSRTTPLLPEPPWRR